MSHLKCRAQNLLCLALFLQQIEEAERSFTLDETVPPQPDSEDYGEFFTDVKK